uniref:FRamide n=1 Tax=Tripedalia cystophora TaxID=6141 RepID=A0A482A4P3_TRICY|nr:FRamide [Tripedalia cystophora]
MSKEFLILQRILWLTLIALAFTWKVAAVSAKTNTKSEIYENWATNQETENQDPVSQDVSCEGELCLYGNRQLARRKVLKGKTVCGQGGCVFDPQAKAIDQELDAAEMDTYGVQYNHLPRDSSCKGQMCWFRGRREKLSASDIQERLLAQLSFLRELNRREMRVSNEKKAEDEEGCTGQMCWFRGKKEYEGKEGKSSCVGQMCWFRGKRGMNKKDSNSCTGQMCWFRGKRNLHTKESGLKKSLGKKKRCTGQMCWFRGGRSSDPKEVDELKERQRGKRTQKENMCTGQMCWFRGRKELQAQQMGCKGQMCWFRGKRNAKKESKN